MKTFLKTIQDILGMLPQKTKEPVTIITLAALISGIFVYRSTIPKFIEAGTVGLTGAIFITLAFLVFAGYLVWLNVKNQPPHPPDEKSE